MDIERTKDIRAKNILKKARSIDLKKNNRIRLGNKVIIEIDKMRKEYQNEADPAK